MAVAFAWGWQYDQEDFIEKASGYDNHKNEVHYGENTQRDPLHDCIRIILSLMISYLIFNRNFGPNISYGSNRSIVTKISKITFLFFKSTIFKIFLRWSIVMTSFAEIFKF